jgi:hypothetical protein
MVRRRKFKTIRSKETSQISMVKRSERSNVRREATRNFRNKKREDLKDKINEFATHGNNKNTRDLYKRNK